MRKHEDRVAIITGGAGAIGFAIAQRLARGGARVATFDASGTATEAAGRLPGPRDAHLAVDVDVTDDVAVGNAVSAVVSRYGRVDILVNCAGIVLRHDGKKLSLREVEPDDWRRSIEINLTAVYLCARAALPAMCNRGWGRIVTISSQGGRTGGVFSSVDYGAAKAGVIGFSRTLAIEVGQFGITVNCVAPGRVRSPMTAHVGEQAQNEAFLGSLPVPRMAEADEIAAAVAFLCSDEAAYITGATLDVNGGGFMS
jgi:3-oxoacyl-[acyl-carrier protein] reductase